MAVTRLGLSAPAFYTFNQSYAYTFRLEVRLKREVDGGMLRRALDKAMPRYPYFAVRLAVDGEEYVLEDNPLPVVIAQGIEPVCLNSEASNYHLIALAYEASTICFDVSHALMDGTGALPWVKTILHYYLCEREGIALDPTGIRLAESELPEEEVTEPYPETVPEDIVPIGVYKPVPALRLDVGEGLRKQICYHVRIAENAFVRYSKEQDGSPATLTNVFLAKAVAALHPGEEKPIVGGMALNIRPALRKPLAHHCHVPLLYLKYDPARLSGSVTTLATCSRGMVILQSQRENVLTYIRGYKRLMTHLTAAPLAQKHAMIAHSAAAAKQNATFSVSYVGRADWGALEPYMEAAYIACDVADLGIMIELMAVDGGFDLCFMQEFEGDAYVRQFAAELAKEGIASDISGPYPLRVAGLKLA